MGNHIVHKQRITIKASRHCGAAVQRHLNDTLHEQLASSAETLFNQFAPDDEIVRVEKLNIDLGVIPLSDFEHEFKKRFCFALQESLSGIAGNRNHVTFVATATSSLAVLLHFLRQGHLPWHTTVKDRTQLEARALTEFTKSEWFEIVNFLRDCTEQILLRAISQFSDSFLLEIMKQVSSADWESVYNDLFGRFNAAQANTISVPRLQLWQIVLEEFFTSKDNTSATASGLLKNIDPKVAILLSSSKSKKEPAINYPGSREHIFSTRTRRFLSGELTLKVKYWQPTNDVLRKYARFVAAHHIRRYLPEHRKADTLFSSEIHNLMERMHGEADFRKELSELMDTSGVTTLVKQHLEETLKGLSNESERYNDLPQQEATEVRDRVFLEVGLHVLEFKCKQFDARDKQSNETMDEPSRVFNCGVVLLVHFLKYYFENIGLYTKQGFAGMEAHSRAVLLLNYLATDDTEAFEANLVLQKLICGFPIHEPLPYNMELTEKEKDESIFLLKTVCENWHPLRNTSAEGLRTTFLQRVGRLAMEGNNWRLTIERSDKDIMLELFRPTWNFTTIKLPWMDYILFVDWC